MTVALASDHVGLPLKQAIMAHLDERGISYRDFGTDSEERCDYPQFALPAAKAVAAGEYTCGILCCGTGVGMSIAANKVKGVRCVVCSDGYSAALSRAHNDTNMLALGSRVVGAGLAVQIVDWFLDTPYEGGRHARRLEQIREIERSGELPAREGG